MVAGEFNSEALGLMQAMLDQAWADLPARQTNSRNSRAHRAGRRDASDPLGARPGTAWGLG